MSTPNNDMEAAKDNPLSAHKPIRDSDWLDTELRRLWQKAQVSGYGLGTKDANNKIYMSLQAIIKHQEAVVLATRITEFNLVHNKYLELNDNTFQVWCYRHETSELKDQEGVRHEPQN